MANIFENNRHNLKLKINYDEYWDFFINKDSFSTYNFMNGLELYDKCLISYIDLTRQEECVKNDWLYSLDNYRWEYSTTSGYTLYNVGYTGVDNGLFQFRKDRIRNSDFVKIFNESEYSFIEGDSRLKLHAVSGNTLKYEYPYTILKDCVKLNGGFYQGIFKTECDKYQILPSNLQNEIWNFEFVLNKTEFEQESDKTLNISHPNNKGIFFYLGTRAENKWINLYEDESECEDLGVQEYVEGGEIDKKSWIISSFLDNDFYFEQDDHLVSMEIDNFVDYTYYPSELYENHINDDDFSEDYFEYDFEESLITVNDKTLGEDLKECCQKKQDIKITTKIRCCNCGTCKKITEVYETNGENYGVACYDPFGLDYLNDVNTLEDEDFVYVDAELDIADFDYQTVEHGISLSDFRKYKYIYTDNKFLLFHRRKDGFKISNWIEDSLVEYRVTKNNFKGNLFLLMNRTCTGYTVATIDGYRSQFDEKYNIYNDLYNNALAFRITDDGKIGYRYLTVDCELSGENRTKIIEGYSNPRVIKENTWHTIHVKVYGKRDTMSFKFYVDGKLIYVTDEMPLLKLKKLAENDEKQELVPFNLSLGGGSQGLCDVIMPNYMVTYNTLYPIEENFGGTFIGYMRKFRWYGCDMEYMNILNNSKYENNNL